VSFRDLHGGDLPFLLPNAWDVASATPYAEMQERLVRYGDVSGT
jgi:2-methylisocitrate lyase-like PEP mutase family enzyme